MGKLNQGLRFQQGTAGFTKQQGLLLPVFYLAYRSKYSK